MSSQSAIEKELVKEIRAMPSEYLPNLLQIVRIFRDSVELRPAEESFRDAWRNSRRGERRPISELWDGIDAE